MRPFLTRHPFIKQLMKLVAVIVVGYNTFMITAMLPFVALLAVLVAIGSSVPDTADQADATTYETLYGHGFNELLSIKIDGTIVGDADGAGSILGGGTTSGYEVKKKLYRATDDDQIKGIVLEVTSPGGTIYGARAIADGVKYYRDKTKKPLYTYIQGVGASGAYWAAASTDRIIADYGSDIGSIGVIMGPFKYYNKPVSEDGGLLEGGVVTQNGIEAVTITAGKSKDIGSPYRRLTPEELQSLQQQVNNDYDDFVKFVSDRRSIPEATIRGQIGAMPYDNKTAQGLKLIDQTGSKEDAYEKLAEAADVKDDFTVVREETKLGFVASLLSAVLHKPQRQASAADTAAMLCRLSQSRLAYSGNVTDLCPASQP